MTRSTVIGVAVLVALAGVTACGGSRSQPAVSGPGSAASAPLSSPSTERPAPHVAVRVVTMRGSEAPGPERYDRVRVVRIGSSSARHVLVLLAGTSAGAGYFVPVAEDLVMALHGWQVWAVDRRENLLEDHIVLDRARAGGLGGRELFDYYLGWIANPAVGRHYRPPADDRVAFARRLGMRVAVADVARVVHAARAGGRDVVLGGQSLGGWIATAYAAWDFGGRAGAADLDGLVLITSPESLAAGQAHLGGLAASGDPRGFQDGGYATAARHQRNRRRRRNGLVSPAPPDARRKGHRRRCRQPRADAARPERHAAPTSTCPSTRSRRRSSTARS